MQALYLALALQHPWLFAPIQQQTLEQTSHMMLEYGLVGAEPDVGVTRPSRVFGPGFYHFYVRLLVA